METTPNFNEASAIINNEDEFKKIEKLVLENIG